MADYPSPHGGSSSDVSVDELNASIREQVHAAVSRSVQGALLASRTYISESYDNLWGCRIRKVFFYGDQWRKHLLGHRQMVL